MRTWTLGIAAAALSLFGASSAAGPGDEVRVTRAVLHTRWVDVPWIPYAPPQRMPAADVELKGLLPVGFPNPDRGPQFAVYPPTPLPVQILLNGVPVLGVDDPVTISPTGRKGVWRLTPDIALVYSPYRPWIRARVDSRRGTFRFRTRTLDHAVMEGDPAAVPLLLRIGGRELGATVDFLASDPDLWSFTRWEPRSVPALPR